MAFLLGEHVRVPGLVELIVQYARSVVYVWRSNGACDTFDPETGGWAVGSVVLKNWCGTVASAAGQLYFYASGVMYRPRPDGTFTRDVSPWEALLRLLPDTRVATFKNHMYLVGGHLPLDGAIRYCPTTARWEQCPGLLDSRFHHELVPLGHRLYAIGGATHFPACRTLSSVETFDGRRWTAVASLRRARSLAACAACRGRLYVCGGSTAEVHTADATVEVYDPRRNTWSFVAPLPVPVRSATAFAVSGMLYVCGGVGPGYLGSRAVQRYDPTRDRWERLPTDCPWSMQHHTCAVV